MSPRGAYVAAVVLLLFGVLTSLAALSTAMRWSGGLIALLGVLLASWTRWTTGKRR